MNSLAFDESSHPVAVVAEKPPTIDDETAIRHETMARLLQFLTERAASVKHIGTRVLILAYYMETPEAPRTQKELGERLGMSKSAVSMALKRLGDLVEM